MTDELRQSRNKNKSRMDANINAPLTVRDVGDVLRGIASVYRNPRAGNLELAEIFVKLSKILESYGGLSVAEILDKLGNTPVDRLDQRNDLHLSDAPDLTILQLDDIRELLGSGALTRAELVRLGNQRFGISKSKLDRLSRERIIQAVKIALDNTQALDIISRQASSETNRRLS